MWENRFLFQLSGNVLNVIPVTAKINIFTREREVILQLRLAAQITFGPIIDGLATNQNVRQSVRIPHLKNFGELLEGKASGHRSGPLRHHPGHMAQIGNLPLGSVAHEGGATLVSQRRA